MCKTSDSLVLIIDDAGLRSTLTARLGLAGETIHLAADPSDSALIEPHRRRAILIVEEARVPPGGLDGGRDAFWPGPIIVLGDRREGQPIEAPGIVRIARSSAARSVVAQVSAWRDGEARI